MTILKRLTILLIIPLFTQISLAETNKIPVKDFFKNAEFSGLQISPNGKYLAVISPINGRRNIAVMETEGLKNIRGLTGLKKQNVANFFWANNDGIVFTMDTDGNEAFGIYHVSIKGKIKIRTLVSPSAGASGIRSASVVHQLPDDPNNILVQFNGRRVKSPDLYRLPLKSNWNNRKRKNTKMKLIAQNPGDVQSWIVDNDGDLRGAISVKGTRGKFHYKEKGAKDFAVLNDFSIFDENINPLGFTYDNKKMYVTSNIGRDKNAIYIFDPVENKLGEMIYGHDEVDVAGLITSRKQQKLLGISYFYKYPNTVYFDDATKIQMKNLSSAFPNKRVNVTSTSKDEMLQVLLVNDDQDPGSYYLYDKKKGDIRYLLSVNKLINPNDMSPMEPIEFKSRDGLTIHGYVTIPKNSSGKNLPLIINPHGGPFGVRDFWRYNAEHQFFANRGYATVQVNYRGSGGYGRTFEQAGYGGKWGAEMQDDLTDAVKHLIHKGIIDADRVCIYGASYGGYATMAGLTFTPELYKCGINYVGVTDIGLLFSSMPRHWEPLKDVMKIQIGDPDDKELMNRMSPLAHVDKIKVPLMIIQGAKDPRVVKQHATDLRDALEDRGITLSDNEWIMKLDEGHGFSKEENRIELYQKMEKFLAKHL